MSNKPLVSVLMCSYNAAKYIKHTIDSVLQQSYRDFEFLILDNNSSDDTVQIIRSISDERIKFLQSQSNLWPYWWLNKLLEQATGKYIAIQDHDDLWHPEKLMEQVTFLQKNKQYVGCGTKTLMYYTSDKKWFEYYLGEKSFYTIHPSLVFRNQWYKYPESDLYMSDAYFQKKTLCRWKKTLYNIDKTLVIHRIHDDNNNLSYTRFSYTWPTIKRLFYIHSVYYAIGALCIETIRRLLYPYITKSKINHLIVIIERFPFLIQWNRIYVYTNNDVEKLGFSSDWLV